MATRDLSPNALSAHPRADAWCGWTLCATLFATALVFSFRLTSFLHAKEAVLHLGLLLVGLGWTARRDWTVFAGYRPLWFGLAVVAILWLVAVEPAVRPLALEELERVIALLLFGSLSIGLCARPVWRQRVRWALVLSAGAVALLGLAQYAGMLGWLLPRFPEYTQPVYSVMGNQDLFGGYLAMAAPLAGVLFLRTAPAPRSGRAVFGWAALFAVLLAGLVVSESRSAWLAAAVGLALVVPFSAGRRRTALFAALMLCVFLAVTVAATWERTSVRLFDTFSPEDVGGNARLWFWAGTWRMIEAAPWMGVGPGNYAYWSPLFLGRALLAHGPGMFHNEQHTLHAHSEPLELLAETGVAGALFLCWMLFRLVRRRGPEWPALAALLVFACFNAALHSAPHALAGLVLAGMLLMREAPAAPKAGRAAAAAVVASCIVIPAVFAAIVLVPSYLLCAAEDAHVRGEDPRALYRRVFHWGWPDARAREEYGMALLEAEQPEAAYGAFLRARDGLDTGRLYLNLAQTASALEDDEMAARWAVACLMRWPWHREAWQFAAPQSGAPLPPGWAKALRRWRPAAFTASESQAASPPGGR